MTETQLIGESESVALPTVRGHPFDPPAELGRFREQEPLRRLLYPDGHVGWLVTSHVLARAVLANPRFSARGELRRLPIPYAAAAIVFAQPANFQVMDPPEHSRYRRLVTGHFTMRRVNELRPRIEQIVDEQLNAMEQAGPPVDLVETFALPVPSLAICELLGVPDRNRAEFQRQTTIVASLTSSAEEAAVAWRALTDYLRKLIQHKRLQPADDVLSGLATSGELTSDELVGLGVLLLSAGFETTANMLALGTFALLQNPDQLDMLRADPALINNAVEELLRYLSIVHVSIQRTALEDVELQGRLIKNGETVTISLPAANRDPEKFEEPDKLYLRRNVSGHVAFGHGIHACLGQQLARIEMQIGYPALFRRFPALRLAVPPKEIPLSDDMIIYGVHRLPVEW